jgi:Carboxypeptidase regulatory-like domain
MKSDETGRRRHACAVLALLFGVLLMLAGTSIAQVANTGSVQGTVADSSGSLLSGANVSLVELQTGAAQTTNTNADGSFRFPIVPVGDYRLDVTMQGFKSFRRSGISVHAAEPASIVVTLTVGAVAEKIEVIAAQPTVDTVTASEGNTVTGKQLNELPLTNRLFTQLVNLEPGVASNLDQNPGFGSNSEVLFSVNGVRNDENNLMVDGVRNLDTFGGNAFVAPNLFAVSEFRVENNSYSAATGRSGGAQVNLISRNGTNQFHGNVFEFFRNNVMNASYAGSGQIVPENRYNDFGYDVGGPIIKNKLFFFWSQEWRRIIQSSGLRNATVPTDAERGGDFSALSQTLIDPNTGLPFTTRNVIPQGEQDSNAQLLLAANLFWPEQNRPGLVNNFFSAVPDYTRWREESIRLDYRASERLSAFLRLTQDTANLYRPYGLFGENPLPYVGDATQKYPIYNGVFNLTYSWTPSLVSQFLFGLYRDNDLYLRNGPKSCRCRVPGLNIPELFPLNEGDRIPTFDFASPYSGIVEQWYFYNASYSMPIAIDNTWNHGAHTVRFGFALTREGKNELANPSNNSTNGVFNFDGSASGDAMADFLLGKAFSYSETALDPYAHYRWYNFEPYVEDQWKVRRNLTLTMGLRYTYYQPEYEQNNFFASFDPTKWVASQAPTVNPDGTLVPASGNFSNGIIVAGSSSPYGRGLFASKKDVFAPRIGLAWDVMGDGKTSVRAGYGIFYDRWGSYSQFGGLYNPPLNQKPLIFHTDLSNPGGATGTIFPPLVWGVANPWNYPQIQKWSAGIQREVGFDTSVSVAYVGTKGTHLLGSLNLNQPTPAGQQQVIAGANVNTVRPHPGYGTVYFVDPVFGSNYNSLQASVVHRLRHDVAFQVSYTYSKTTTDNSSPWNIPQDSRNIRADNGLASFDIPQVLTFNYVWDVPAFRNSSGAKKTLLGGWQVSGITEMQKGFPATVTLATDNAGVGGGLERANQTAGADGPKTRTQWFNTSAFTYPAPATFGDEKNGAVRGPGFVNFDFALGKRFFVRESTGLEFKAQAFNVFNHVSYQNVDTSLGPVSSPNLDFGHLSNPLAPRTLQLSLALSF